MSPLRFVAAILLPLGWMSHLHADPDVRNSLTATEIAAQASAAAVRTQQAARDVAASTDRRAPAGPSAREKDAPSAWGGAIFSPFADAPTPLRTTEVADEKAPPDSAASAATAATGAPGATDAGFGLTLVAAAGASAALFWLLRRS